MKSQDQIIRDLAEPVQTVVNQLDDPLPAALMRLQIGECIITHSNSQDPLEQQFADNVRRIRQALQNTPYADLPDPVIAKSLSLATRLVIERMLNGDRNSSIGGGAKLKYDLAQGALGIGAEKIHRQISQAALRGLRRRSFSEFLSKMPNAGEGADFAREQ